MPMHDATRRFSTRAENYLRYRPGYPHEVIDLLKTECGMSQDSVVADVAFGTGIFTRMLLEKGNRVIGVEPNPEMRRAGEGFLARYPRFTSVSGTAEDTTLPAGSIDIVTTAQAAHWFDPQKAKNEFSRILKPAGWIALVWNDRRVDSTEFQREYENLIRAYGTDYTEVRQRGMTLAIDAFFGQSSLQSRQFEYRQVFDYARLEGRLLSSSYAPQKGDTNFDAMLCRLRQIFDDHQKNGRVSFDYDTRVYYARLS